MAERYAADDAVAGARGAEAPVSEGRATNDSVPLSKRAQHPRGASRGTGLADQIRNMLAPHRQDVVARLVDLAKQGDPACLRLYMERIAPAPRPEDEKVSIPGLASASTLRAKAEAILAAASRGEISAFAADKLMSLLDKYNSCIIATDHESRLKALEEGRLPAKPIDGEVIGMEGNQ